MQALSLFDDFFILPTDSVWHVDSFSADSINDDSARRKLEDKYWPITEVTDKFNRQSVSYQLSKKDKLHRWLKYKEGFSAELVRLLIKEFNIKPGDVVLDPFMGSGTTALVACMQGINSMGFDILPMTKYSISAKMAAYRYDITELKKLLREIENLQMPDGYNKHTSYLSITTDGYPEQTSKEIAFYDEFLDSSDYSNEAKCLLRLCILNSLEKVSYSRKDGQYLRWDYRCPKIIKANQARVAAGKKPLVTRLDKGELPSMKMAMIDELTNVIEDIAFIQTQSKGSIDGTCDFIEGSALFEMPKKPSNSINGVISSPPYCNRYDYTRTYAMELAYLGVTEVGIRTLRQELLSCTVENKTKLDRIEECYKDLGKIDDFNFIMNIVNNNDVLNEINLALANRNKNGEINNKGVLQMVKGYFTELTFLFFEIFRMSKSGSCVAFVNDNVRYAGEVIPVDFLTTYLAEQIGFIPKKVYTLKQTKGNSSQQMAKYGRVALRKSITVWQKP